MPTGNYISLKVKNEQVAKLVHDLSHWSIQKQIEVKREVATSAYVIEGDAKRHAPTSGKAKFGGILKNRIFTDIKPDGLGAQNWSDVPYAPYQEFGTGDLVNVPKGYEEFALQFKGKGIRKVNIKALHFLYNAWNRESRNFMRNVKKIMGIKS